MVETFHFSVSGPITAERNTVRQDSPPECVEVQTVWYHPEPTERCVWKL